MRAVEKRGRNVEEAVNAALADLGISREQALVEVMEEGSRGLFGLLGGKEALVRVANKVDKSEVAEEFLDKLLLALGYNGTIGMREEEEHIRVDVSGDGLRSLIGRQGEVLDSLQFLLNVAASRTAGGGKRLVVDVDGYRARREETVRNLALQVAEKVKRSGQRAMLEAMNAHERKLVHLVLQEEAAVQTHSEGDEPHRRVIIEPKQEEA